MSITPAQYTHKQVAFATRIQASYRGYRVRQEYKRLKGVIKPLQDLVGDNNLAPGETPWRCSYCFAPTFSGYR